MPKRIRVINTTKNIWFNSIQEAAAYAQADGWTMSKKMEALSKCADNKLLSATVNKALVEIIKIGETTKGGDNDE